MESETRSNMEYLKYILYSFIVLAMSSCEYDLIRFGWTDYSVDERFNDSKAYNETHPAQCLEVDSDEYSFIATSDYHLHQEEVFLPQLFCYINSSCIVVNSKSKLMLFIMLVNCFKIEVL